MFAVIAVPSASAKEFNPGDIRICGAKRCVAVMNRVTLKRLSSFIYLGPDPQATTAAPMGAPAYQLRFRNGYVTGIVAGKALDRWLSYGVYIGRFTRDTWYRVPTATAADLRRLAVGLAPLRVTPEAVARSR